MSSPVVCSPSFHGNENFDLNMAEFVCVQLKRPDDSEEIAARTKPEGVCSKTSFSTPMCFSSQFTMLD